MKTLFLIPAVFGRARNLMNPKNGELNFHSIVDSHVDPYDYTVVIMADPKKKFKIYSYHQKRE